MNNFERTQMIQDTFNDQAKNYDKQMSKIIPFYLDMLDALINAIPFESKKSLKICELGCGTGNVTLLLKQKFPSSKITCVDMSENMLKAAKTKLNKYSDITYILKDFDKLKFTGKFDLIISSLALHHLETDENKKQFYQKIYAALKKDGVFYNADVTKGATAYLEKMYLTQWIEFMQMQLKDEEIKEYIKIRNRSDIPVSLDKHITWLKEIGFKNVDVVWKYYAGTVYGAIK
ncbi:MAG: class I SAM-dependent methyltransferase [Bacteroidetes bacterium]|nr:class I SAM-dependent methyltransferase [Bacteroidota bacterium]